MNRYLTPARWIGLLLLLQMGVGPLVNFGLLGPALSGARRASCRTRLARDATYDVATLLALGRLGLLRRGWRSYSCPSRRPTASSVRPVAFVVLAVHESLATAVLEGAAIRAMLALSQAFHEAGATGRAAFEPLASRCARCAARPITRRSCSARFGLTGAAYARPAGAAHSCRGCWPEPERSRRARRRGRAGAAHGRAHRHVFADAARIVPGPGARGLADRAGRHSQVVAIAGGARHETGSW